MAATKGVADRTACLKVLGLQLDNVDATCVEDRRSNCRLAATWIKRHPGHRLYLLGELYAIGYSTATLDALPKLAEPLGGETCAFFCQLAQDVGAYVCFGFAREFRRPRDGVKCYTVCQAVAGPEGTIIASYDKLHCCQFGDCVEQDYFTCGDRVCTFNVDGFTVGLMICYDIRFPELARELAWKRGADVLLIPSAFPKDIAFPSWHPFVVTRALENQVFAMSLSRAGSHFGCSIAVPPWLEPPETGSGLQVRTLGDGASVLPMVVDAEVLHRVRTSYSLRGDRHALFGCAGDDDGPSAAGTATSPSAKRGSCGGVRGSGCVATSSCNAERRSQVAEVCGSGVEGCDTPARSRAALLHAPARPPTAPTCLHRSRL